MTVDFLEASMAIWWLTANFYFLIECLKFEVKGQFIIF